MAEVIDIPFKVSARTARLIGRENIATSKGAIIELVKNGFDADSKISIVYFDNQYSAPRDHLTQEQIALYLSRGIKKAVLDEVYDMSDDGFSLRENVADESRQNLKSELNKLNCLYIIDAGEGMTQKIIRDHWMTIGTDNKALDVFTKSGRVKAGAKGIGRFALDKLGSKCEMITIFNPEAQAKNLEETEIESSNIGYRWEVNWEDFEGEFKTIDKVSARLTGLQSTSFISEITANVSGLDLSKITSEVDFQYGTILKITELRENWEDYFVDQVYSDLEVLVPPKETGGFEIYLFSSLEPDKYGEVFGSICDDYDYKITAVADENQNVKIRVDRMEYDVSLIPPDFFNREGMKSSPYRKEDFAKGYWTAERTFAQLLPGFAKIDESNVFKDIGVFDFSFYYLKRGFSTPDAERFFYKRFQSNFRRDWLDKFGGVKLFRDNFRVRPYGEAKDVAFDWLGLGNRKAQSPAGVAKKEGGYRVEPENVAGAIKISRLTNLNFEDKSSREGLQENTTFQIFKTLIAAIINVFEVDRSYIAKEMDTYDSERFFDERTREEAEAVAKRVLKASRDRKASKQQSGDNEKGDGNSPSDDPKDQELAIIAELNERKDEEIEKLKEEQKVLRGLASSGIVLASFSHDLSKLNNVLNSRVDKLRDLFSEKVQEQEYAAVEDRKNPFMQLERMKKTGFKTTELAQFFIRCGTKR